MKRVQAFRYVVAGLTAFISEYLLFVLLHNYFPLPLYVNHGLSFGLGLLISFSLNRSWGFATKTFQFSQSMQFIVYFGLALYNLIFTTMMLEFMVRRGANPLIAKPMLMILVAGWNFVIYRTVIFKPSLQRRAPLKMRSTD